MLVSSIQQPIGILNEHPQWFLPLFAELERRGLRYEPIHADGLVFDPADRDSHYSLVARRGRHPCGAGSGMK